MAVTLSIFSFNIYETLYHELPYLIFLNNIQSHATNVQKHDAETTFIRLFLDYHHPLNEIKPVD